MKVDTDLASDELIRVMYQWEKVDASPDQTAIIVKLGELLRQVRCQEDSPSRMSLSPRAPQRKTDDD